MFSPQSTSIDLDTSQPIAPKRQAINAATTAARKGTLPRSALNLEPKTNYSTCIGKRSILASFAFHIHMRTLGARMKILIWCRSYVYSYLCNIYLKAINHCHGIISELCFLCNTNHERLDAGGRCLLPIRIVPIHDASACATLATRVSHPSKILPLELHIVEEFPY